MTTSGESWTERSLCREMDPEIFFPVSTTGAALGHVRRAQAVCDRCPVASHCLDWAMRTGQDHGIWGGTTPEQRRALRIAQMPR